MSQTTPCPGKSCDTLRSDDPQIAHCVGIKRDPCRASLRPPCSSAPTRLASSSNPRWTRTTLDRACPASLRTTRHVQIPTLSQRVLTPGSVLVVITSQCARTVHTSRRDRLAPRSSRWCRTRGRLRLRRLHRHLHHQLTKQRQAPRYDPQQLTPRLEVPHFQAASPSTTLMGTTLAR